MAEAAASVKGGGSEVKGGEESKDITDLFGLIETQTLECLNQDNAHPVTHCLGQVRAPSPLPNSTCEGRQSCVATLSPSWVASPAGDQCRELSPLVQAPGNPGDSPLVQAPQPEKRPRQTSPMEVFEACGAC